MNKERSIINLYSKLEKNLIDLQWRYHKALGAFHIFDTLKKTKSSPHAGRKKVHKNVQIWNVYKHFFIPVEESVRVYFILELAKFFDPDKDSLTLDYLIEKIEKNFSSITRESFLIYCNSKGVTAPSDWMMQYYKSINLKDLNNAKRALKNIKDVVERLTDYRNKWLAHDDRLKKEIPIKKHEFTRLLKVVEKILNDFSNKLFWSITLHEQVKNEHACDTKNVIESLIFAHAEKQKEIVERFKLKKKSSPTS